ncbi:hypothetical protein C8F04DRAFT_1397559 [Mycena alexandri]|uniref:Uncharacterized protein n=1 Tax=Mycena alexandri TaxID=1745969 RepID=A0AAD6SN59_9AGAR|nr:hypothetical protein C8F04DRAFT_1397559 [Mycena alexandri]
MPATFRTTLISASKQRAPTRRISLLSLASSIASTSSSFTGTSILSSGGDSCLSSTNLAAFPIVVTTTTSTTSVTYPATVPPPFATSLGSDDVLPRPRRGAPAVLPAKSVEERMKAQKRREQRSAALWRAIGLKPTGGRSDPALCEGWCNTLV